MSKASVLVDLVNAQGAAMCLTTFSRLLYDAKQYTTVLHRFLLAHSPARMRMLQLVLINVSDHHTRSKANAVDSSGGQFRVLGCLLGQQVGASNATPHATGLQQYTFIRCRVQQSLAAPPCLDAYWPQN